MHVAQQRRLALVVRVELAGEGDLVDAQAGLARGALERGERVLAALVLGHRERDPLLGLQRQRAVAQLRAEARVGAQRGRGEPASTPTMFESWPPPASAPFSTGTLRSGAVSSSWTWNRLSLVFIAASLSRAGYLR